MAAARPARRTKTKPTMQRSRSRRAPTVVEIDPKKVSAELELIASRFFNASATGYEPSDEVIQHVTRAKADAGASYAADPVNSPTAELLFSTTSAQNRTHDLIDQLLARLESVLTAVDPPKNIGEDSPEYATPLLQSMDKRLAEQRGINSRLERLIERIRL